MRSTIFLDMDGVVFDFESHYKYLFGHSTEDVSDNLMWETIKKYGVFTFYYTIPIYKGAKEFVNELESHGNEVVFLTSCPKGDDHYTEAAIAKKATAKAVFGDSKFVIPMRGGKNKRLFMQQYGDLLIDDFEENIESWKSHGGYGIVHTSFEDTTEKFLRYLESDQFQAS